MLYKKKTFTVPAVEKAPEVCDHSEPWTDKWGRCVKCGEQVGYDPAKFRLGERIDFPAP